MKTFRIHFCSHEEVNIHIKTSAVQIVKNLRMRHFFKHTCQPSGGHLDVVLREITKFKMVYLKDGGCYRAKNLQQDIYQGCLIASEG